MFENLVPLSMTDPQWQQLAQLGGLLGKDGKIDDSWRVDVEWTFAAHEVVALEFQTPPKETQRLLESAALDAEKLSAKLVRLSKDPAFRLFATTRGRPAPEMGLLSEGKLVVDALAEEFKEQRASLEDRRWGKNGTYFDRVETPQYFLMTQMLLIQSMCRGTPVPKKTLPPASQVKMKEYLEYAVFLTGGKKMDWEKTLRPQVQAAMNDINVDYEIHETDRLGPLSREMRGS